MCVGEDEMSEFLVFILDLVHARARSLLVVDISLVSLHMRKPGSERINDLPRVICPSRTRLYDHCFHAQLGLSDLVKPTQKMIHELL